MNRREEHPAGFERGISGGMPSRGRWDGGRMMRTCQEGDWTYSSQTGETLLLRGKDVGKKGDSGVSDRIHPPRVRALTGLQRPLDSSDRY